MQTLSAVQGKTHAQNQPAARLLFEDAVAVAKLALGQAELTQLAGVAVQGCQALEHVLDLDAIGANVLHRCGAHGAGDQAEVFQAGQPLLQRPQHKSVPDLPRLSLDDGALTIVGKHPNTATGHA